MGVRLTGITRYPVKSCRGQPVSEAVVGRCGLSADRRWMLVDPAGDAVTARDRPPLVLVRPVPLEESADQRHPRDGGEGVVLRATGRPDLAVRRPVPDPVPVRVHGHGCAATPAAPAAHAWFSELLGEPVRLVYLDDPDRRRPDPAFTTDVDRVSLADAYPLLLASQASLEQLNRLVADGPHAEEGPLPMTRFRPNLVVDGAEAWAEETWQRVRIGDGGFRVVKGCARCVLTTVHPDTAERGREPLHTLARHRRRDGKVWFGVNLVPDTPGAVISVGDEVRPG